MANGRGQVFRGQENTGAAIVFGERPPVFPAQQQEKGTGKGADTGLELPDKGWWSSDANALVNTFGELQNKAAQMKMLGYDPMKDPNFQTAAGNFKAISLMSAENKDAYERAEQAWINGNLSDKEWKKWKEVAQMYPSTLEGIAQRNLAMNQLGLDLAKESFKPGEVYKSLNEIIGDPDKWLSGMTMNPKISEIMSEVSTTGYRPAEQITAVKTLFETYPDEDFRGGIGMQTYWKRQYDKLTPAQKQQYERIADEYSDQLDIEISPLHAYAWKSDYQNYFQKQQDRTIRELDDGGGISFGSGSLKGPRYSADVVDIEPGVSTMLPLGADIAEGSKGIQFRGTKGDNPPPLDITFNYKERNEDGLWVDREYRSVSFRPSIVYKGADGKWYVQGNMKEEDDDWLNPNIQPKEIVAQLDGAARDRFEKMYMGGADINEFMKSAEGGGEGGAGGGTGRNLDANWDVADAER